MKFVGMAGGKQLKTKMLNDEQFWKKYVCENQQSSGRNILWCWQRL
jgi:hypothetical protein